MNQNHLFDTSVFIAHIRNSIPEASNWIARSANHEIHGAASALTYYELFRGATNEQKLRQCKVLIRPMTIYGVSKDIADIAAEIYKKLPANERNNKDNHDILIAATAQYYQLAIVTDNIKDFSRFSLSVKLISIKS